MNRRLVMGIVNCTPDSFYTGTGRVPALRTLSRRIEQQLAHGADILDIGGYSTRPYADEVSLEEEWRRVEQGLRAAHRVMQTCNRTPMLSVDTFRSEVARRAIEQYGVELINDVSGGDADPAMWPLIADKGAWYVAMHMRGTPQTMMRLTDYDDVVGEVTASLAECIERMAAAGIDRRRIILDPGFGFAKDLEQEYLLVEGVERIAALGCPVLVGISRKSMLTKALHIDKADSLPATTALHWELLRRGAAILRVHDVSAARQVIALYDFYEQITKR